MVPGRKVRHARRMACVGFKVARSFQGQLTSICSSLLFRNILSFLQGGISAGIFHLQQMSHSARRKKRQRQSKWTVCGPAMTFPSQEMIAILLTRRLEGLPCLTCSLHACSSFCVPMETKDVDRVH